MQYSKGTPIPPRSVVKLMKGGDSETPEWRDDIGRIFRIGYYSRQDGTDVVWLVNSKGEYEQTTNHDFLRKYFVLVEATDEDDFFGDKREPLGEYFEE
jgi:hypothetical protein